MSVGTSTRAPCVSVVDRHRARGRVRVAPAGACGGGDAVRRRFCIRISYLDPPRPCGSRPYCRPSECSKARPLPCVSRSKCPTGRRRSSSNPCCPTASNCAARPARTRVRLEVGSPAQVDWQINCAHWGVYELGALRVRVVEPLSAHEELLGLTSQNRLKVLPRVEHLRTLVAPMRTHGFGGSNPARRVGQGIEFAQMRPYQPGDRRADVNWRVSSRRGSLWVSGRHPDESADVVLFLDSFLDVGGQQHGSLDASIRLASALVQRYLAERDRVGIVGFGGVMRWLPPASGPTHQYRLLDTLLDTQVFESYADKRLANIPVRALPPHALVIVISPLLDERARAAIQDLARFDSIAVDVSANCFAHPLPDRAGRLAARVWSLERAARRQRLRDAAVPVIEWRPDEPIEPVIDQLERWHRRMGTKRA